MPCTTVRELLEHISGFHRQLGTFYEGTAAKADQVKAKALLEYMGRHEKHLRECLDAYEKDASKRILDTGLQFMPDIAKCECFERMGVDEDMSIRDVVRISLWFDDCLLEFIREMVELSVPEDVKELFASLAKMEEQAEQKVTRSSLEVIEGV